MLEQAMKGVVAIAVAVLGAFWLGYGIDKIIPVKRKGRPQPR